nr:lysine-specific demethylase lid [Ipomoea batatas]
MESITKYGLQPSTQEEHRGQAQGTETQLSLRQAVDLTGFYDCESNCKLELALSRNSWRVGAQKTDDRSTEAYNSTASAAFKRRLH